MLSNPSGAADMAVDLRSRRINFHTVPAHVRPAPEIKALLPFKVFGNKFLSDLVQWTCRHPPAFSMGACYQTLWILVIDRMKVTWQPLHSFLSSGLSASQTCNKIVSKSRIRVNKYLI